MGWLDGMDWGDTTATNDNLNMNDLFGSGGSNTGYNMSDYWNASNGDLFNYNPYSDPSGVYNYLGTGSLGGAGDSSGVNWGNVASSAYGFLNSPLGGALLAGGAGWLSNKEAFQNAQDMAKLQSQLSQQNYAANKAVDEQYYQSHGKQLSDALGGYAKYYRDPSLAQNNPTNIFGLLTPKPTTGPLANGW